MTGPTRSKSQSNLPMTTVGVTLDVSSRETLGLSGPGSPAGDAGEGVGGEIRVELLVGEIVVMMGRVVGPLAFPVLGPFVVGVAIVGLAVVGDADVGGFVVGVAIVGALRVGRSVIGAPVVGLDDGGAVGGAVGEPVDAAVGKTVGDPVGIEVGDTVGEAVGERNELKTRTCPVCKVPLSPRLAPTASRSPSPVIAIPFGPEPESIANAQAFQITIDLDPCPGCTLVFVQAHQSGFTVGKSSRSCKTGAIGRHSH